MPYFLRTLSIDDHNLIRTSIGIRRKHRLKLPDAIIAACALEHGAVLVTDDSHFSAVDALCVLGTR